MSKTPAYDELAAHYGRLHRFGHAVSMLAWDRSTMMPPGGSTARGAALAELARVVHGLRRDARLAGLVARAAEEPLGAFESANLREMRRDWREAAALPESLVTERVLAGARCEHAWRAQRVTGDWAGFLANFRDVVRLVREEALRLADAFGLAPYDALIERYEPGMRMAELDRLFGELREWLPALITRAVARQGPVPAQPEGPFLLDAQRALCRAVLARVGFDFDAGRLDESAHPFTGGVPEDVRLTTRYREDDYLSALRSTLHEAGHARYAQGLPCAWLDQPVGRPRSFGIHESQSLFVEKQIGRSRAFSEVLAPLVREHLGVLCAPEPAQLHGALTRVVPGPIRVTADEASYPLHIVLRYEIERDLIGAEIEPEDLPALWDEKMAELLGVDTRGNLRDGCLQDVHWSDGKFGYFPSYALGAIYAAQWRACLASAVPDLDARIAAGDLVPAFDWLGANIWSQASRWETAELVRRASGSGLDMHHFRAHLEARYLGDG